MIYDSIGSMDKYFVKQPFWGRIIEFLDGVDASVPMGQYEIASGVFAIIDSYSTKSAINTKMEKHQRYTDLQCLLSGEEFIGYQPEGNSLEVINSVDEASDIGFFEPTHYERFYLKPGLFALFYAGEYHMPQLQVVEGVSNEVIKIVVKIKSDLLF
jgi:YhcH/YjgK/YiaL family protein